MATRTLRASGPADPALAWERYADPSRWAGWAPHLTGVDVPVARLRAGTRGRVFAMGVPVPFQVDAVDEQSRTWAWTVSPRLGPVRLVRLHLEHGVEPEGSGSATWLRMHGPGPVLAAYAPLARLALRRLVAGPAHEGAG